MRNRTLLSGNIDKRRRLLHADGVHSRTELESNLKNFSLKTLAAASILALGLASTAMAETYVLPNGKPLVSITIPESWESTEIAKGVEATSPDEGVYIAAEIVETNKVDVAIKEAVKYLIDNGVEIDQSSMAKKDTKFGTFDAIEVDWTGKDEDGPTQVSVSIVILSETKSMFLTYWASPEAGKANANDLNAIASSIMAPK